MNSNGCKQKKYRKQASMGTSKIILEPNSYKEIQLYNILVFILLSILIQTLGFSQDCIDYGNINQYKGSLRFESIGTFAMHFAVSDTNGFLVEDDKLHIINLANPESPKIISSFMLPLGSEYVTISGKYAYIGAYREFVIFDISNPENLIEVGKLNTPTSVQSVAVSDSLAFILTMDIDNDCGSMIVVNISNPQKPQINGILEFQGWVWEIRISDSLAFVANGESGLQIININNPYDPVIVGNINTPGNTYDVSTSNDYAYIADGKSGLQVVNISTPNNPVLVGYVDTPNDANGVFVLGNIAYITDNASYILVIDISDPKSPKELKKVNTPRGQSSSVVVSKNYAYVPTSLGTDNRALHIISIDKPWQSEDTPYIFQKNCYGFNNVYTAEISGNHVFLGTDRGYKIYDISSQSDAEFVYSSQVPVNCHLTINDTYAYALFNYDLTIYEISDPMHPQYIGSRKTPGDGQSVVVSGSYAYVADGKSGLQIISLIKPKRPKIVGHIDTGGKAISVDVAGNYAYVADYSGGLVIIDISKPSSPQLVKVIAGNCTKVNIIGKHAYLLSIKTVPGVFKDHYVGYMQILDITNPDNPITISEFETMNPSLQFSISESMIYINNIEGGVEIYDISNLSNPKIIGSFYPDWPADYIMADGNRLYIWGNREPGTKFTILPIQCKDVDE